VEMEKKRILGGNRGTYNRKSNEDSKQMDNQRKNQKGQRQKGNRKGKLAKNHKSVISLCLNRSKPKVGPYSPSWGGREKEKSCKGEYSKAERGAKTLRAKNREKSRQFEDGGRWASRIDTKNKKRTKEGERKGLPKKDVYGEEG